MRRRLIALMEGLDVKDNGWGGVLGEERECQRKLVSAEFNTCVGEERERRCKERERKNRHSQFHSRLDTLRRRPR